MTSTLALAFTFTLNLNLTSHLSSITLALALALTLTLVLALALALTHTHTLVLMLTSLALNSHSHSHPHPTLPPHTQPHFCPHPRPSPSQVLPPNATRTYDQQTIRAARADVTKLAGEHARPCALHMYIRTLSVRIGCLTACHVPECHLICSHLTSHRPSFPLIPRHGSRLSDSLSPSLTPLTRPFTLPSPHLADRRRSRGSAPRGGSPKYGSSKGRPMPSSCASRFGSRLESSPRGRSLLPDPCTLCIAASPSLAAGSRAPASSWAKT